jgi:hypothetical protein
MRRYELTDEQWKLIEDLLPVAGQSLGTRSLRGHVETCNPEAIPQNPLSKNELVSFTRVGGQLRRGHDGPGIVGSNGPSFVNHRIH